MAKPADQYCCNMIGRRWMRYGCSTAAADGVGGGISRRYCNIGVGWSKWAGLRGRGEKKISKWLRKFMTGKTLYLQKKWALFWSGPCFEIYSIRDQISCPIMGRFLFGVPYWDTKWTMPINHQIPPLTCLTRSSWYSLSVCLLILSIVSLCWGDICLAGSPLIICTRIST